MPKEPTQFKTSSQPVRQMNTKAETAIEAYLKAMQEIDRQIVALQDKAAYLKADEVKHGHVGDLKRIINLLRQANGEEL